MQCLTPEDDVSTISRITETRNKQIVELCHLYPQLFQNTSDPDVLARLQTPKPHRPPTRKPQDASGGGFDENFSEILESLSNLKRRHRLLDKLPVENLDMLAATLMGSLSRTQSASSSEVPASTQQGAQSQSQAPSHGKSNTKSKPPPPLNHRKMTRSQMIQARIEEDARDPVKVQELNKRLRKYRKAEEERLLRETNFLLRNIKAVTEKQPQHNHNHHHHTSHAHQNHRVRRRIEEVQQAAKALADAEHHRVMSMHMPVNTKDAHAPPPSPRPMLDPGMDMPGCSNGLASSPTYQPEHTLTSSHSHHIHNDGGLAGLDIAPTETQEHGNGANSIAQRVTSKRRTRHKRAQELSLTPTTSSPVESSSAAATLADFIHQDEDAACPPQTEQAVELDAASLPVSSHSSMSVSTRSSSRRRRQQRLVSSSHYSETGTEHSLSLSQSQRMRLIPAADGSGVVVDQAPPPPQTDSPYHTRPSTLTSSHSHMSTHSHPRHPPSPTPSITPHSSHVPLRLDPEDVDHEEETESSMNRLTMSPSLVESNTVIGTHALASPQGMGMLDAPVVAVVPSTPPNWPHTTQTGEENHDGGVDLLSLNVSEDEQPVQIPTGNLNSNNVQHNHSSKRKHSAKSKRQHGGHNNHGQSHQGTRRHRARTASAPSAAVRRASAASHMNLHANQTTNRKRRSKSAQRHKRRGRIMLTEEQIEEMPLWLVRRFVASLPEIRPEHYSLLLRLSEDDVKKPNASDEQIEALEVIIAESHHCTEACVICMDDVEEGQDLTLLPCDHYFHCECIVEYFRNYGSTCPLCKTAI
eukprot:TRINITY_DN66622_c6_g4_i1.p1 TRINITY_DN66622_c6_g4~~TRINITY_DN66622_c6_g4_i1.p1  ORF type:complete len:808 (-),score=46.57 TRINITY_DN66622_c6_g4_i1:1070-3493(-)